MKIWFEYCETWMREENLYLGLVAYKHRSRAISKLDLKSWKGFTIGVHLYKWYVSLHYVNDYEAYLKRMNYRSYRKKEE